MKIERTKNAVRNIGFGIALKVYQIIMPFILRTAMIYFLGIEYVGLNSLFTSILSVLNLAELGVGTAMVFSMYKPIAEDDTETICALMRLYKIYYRIIGLVVLIGGVIVLPFLPCLVSGNVPSNINIYVIFGLNLISTVLSYWMFAYKSCLFSAHQRADITSKVSIISCTVTYLLQFIVLFFLRNYYAYLAVGIATQVLQNVVSALLATKMYPRYQAHGKLQREIKSNIDQRVKDLFTSKIGGIVLNSADTLVISAFLGITTLAVYNNYYYIMSSVIGFIDIIFYACTAGIGNSIITETKDKNYRDFSTLTFIIAWISTLCECCFLNLYQPFMRIWMNNNEELMLSFNIVICLCVYFFVYELNRVANAYKDAAGIWHVDRFRPLVTAGVNLTLNLVLVQVIGLFGVLISTIIATVVINCPWLYSKLFNTVFERKKMKEYVRHVLQYGFVAVIASLVTYFGCYYIPINGLIFLFLRLVVCIILSNIVLFLLLKKKKEYETAKKLIMRIVGHIKTRGDLNK